MESSSSSCSSTPYRTRDSGSVDGDWNSGSILFPYPDGDNYENSDDDESQSISIPRPPPYVPYPRASCKELIPVTRTFDEPKIYGSVRQGRGEDGRFAQGFYEYAKQALEWYNSKTGRNFELLDLVEVVINPLRGLVFDLTIKAVDGDAPNMESPVSFFGRYWVAYSEIVSCEPLTNTAAGSKQKRDSDPPTLGDYINSKFLKYCSTDMPKPARQMVKGFELGKSDSDLPISQPSKFLRDPLICRTELSRVQPPPVSNPGGQNEKDDEPNLSRKEKVEGPIVKSQYCEDYFSDGGCKNEMCRFAHGDWELNEPLYISPKDAIMFHPSCSKLKRKIGFLGTRVYIFAALSFPYIDESHIGIVFGKRGELFQWICDLTGVKLTVENNEEITGYKKIVISGTTNRIHTAITLIRTLLIQFISYSGSEKTPPVFDYKTQLCKKYAEGRCKRDAEKCCFAHGNHELRPSSVQILQDFMRTRRRGNI